MAELQTPRQNRPAESGEDPDYLSYLMRLWRVRDGERETWRGSLECALSGKTYSFASLEGLFGFLRDQTGHTDAGGGEDAGATTVTLVIHRSGHQREEG